MAQINVQSAARTKKAPIAASPRSPVSIMRNATCSIGPGSFETCAGIVETGPETDPVFIRRKSSGPKEMPGLMRPPNIRGPENQTRIYQT